MEQAGSASVQEVYSAGVAHHQAGRLAEAERCYRQVLAVDPRHADSLHLLGVLAHQLRHHEVAIDLIGRAIALSPSIAPFHFNLAIVLDEHGRRDQAVASLRRAVELKPDYPEAHNRLGVVLESLGQPHEASVCYRRAIALRPDFADPHNNHGNVLQHLGRLDEAVACYRQALALTPDFAEAHNNLGNALLQQGLTEEAVYHHRLAIQFRPDYPEAHNNLSSAMRDQGRLAEAIAYARHALALRPDYATAQNNLNLALQIERGIATGYAPSDSPAVCNERGNALQQLARLDDAILCYRRALALKPDFPEVQNNLGNALQQQHRLDEADACYEAAIALRPDYPEAFSNLGNARRCQLRLDEAVALSRRAIELRPDYPAAHTNLAMALLIQGDMSGGLAEYEWRWKTPQLVGGNRGFTQPQWRGEAGEGRTLLLHAEQGLGDTLQFCRYAPLAAARGWRVILEVQAPLVRLLRSLPGTDLVLTAGEPLPPFDVHCPLLSTPLAMGTTVATIPAAVPYLRADPTEVANWAARLAETAGRGPRVGLVWAGSARADLPPQKYIDERRSLAPERLAPLLEVPGLRFVSLQKFGSAAPAHFELLDLMGEVADFADTAALVANLDLVISVDTSVVHLAGALGKPVWLLNRFDSDWRWLLDRRDSPWYPTLRVYRHKQAGDWDTMLAEVVRDLRAFAAGS